MAPRSRTALGGARRIGLGVSLSEVTAGATVSGVRFRGGRQLLKWLRKLDERMFRAMLRRAALARVAPIPVDGRFVLTLIPQSNVSGTRPPTTDP